MILKLLLNTNDMDDIYKSIKEYSQNKNTKY